MKRRTLNREYIQLLAGAGIVIGALTGCGGGGSAGTTTPEASTTQNTSDTTAPSVLGLTPTDGEGDVEPNKVLSAIFSEDMFAVTVDDAGFALNGGGSDVSGTVDFDPLTNVATFTPATPLALLTTYTATLNNTITDLSGNALPQESVSFTTRDGAWGEAEAIEFEEGDAHSPRVSVDDNGNAIAIWAHWIAGDNYIMVSHYTVGSGWGTPMIIDNSSSSTSNPAVAMDSQGNGIAAWGKHDGTRMNIWASYYNADSQSWGVAVLIENDDTFDAGKPSVMFDINGEALAMWTVYNSLWVRRYDAETSSWGTPEAIDNDDSGQVTSYDIGIDGQGNIMAVWSQYNGSIPYRHNIWAKRYSIEAAQWGTAELLENNDVIDAMDPSVDVDAHGNALVVWNTVEGIYDSIWANYYDVDDDSWSAPTLLEAEDGWADKPSVALDDNGNGYAVWTQYSGAGFTGALDVKLNSFDADSGWATATTLDTAVNQTYQSPQIALDNTGNGLVLWGQANDESRAEIWGSRYRVGTGWATPEALAQHAALGAYSPRISVNKYGVGVAVWEYEDNDEEFGNIWSSHFE